MIMKTIKLISALALSAFAFIACNMNKENPSKDLDWEGVYSNVIPCADCEGIQTTVILNKDMSYIRTSRYLGKDMNFYTEKGTFSWNEEGNEITLGGIDSEESPINYRVEKNKLVQHDINGKPMEESIQAKYSLKKVSDIVEKHWKLIELNGKEITTAEHQPKEAFFILNTENNRVNGSGGCNSFSGMYILSNGNSIQFSPLASTMMACLKMETESEMFKAMETVDNYSIKGDTLSLHKAGMAPLAKFVAVKE